ncbi:S41 family peptidase [Sphingobacterium sp. UBA1498]|uniref:S41 family peptidase n=1 Tax=Sphingobacterium sp. UBA1498 TaxID=1947481 RepID=UPI0025FBDC8D|nr:S41 family peptidase [Sphingobacterium sp. UBA1498]
MKKPVIYLFLLLYFFTLISCTSVAKYNRFIQTPLSVKAMLQDINYVERNLWNMHPDLFLYVQQNQLKAKFDSLRSTIRQPLLPNQFQLALAAVLAQVRQGHMTLSPLIFKFDPKGKDKVRYQKSKGPLSQLGFHWTENTLYLSKNGTSDSTLLVGSKILAIEGIQPQSLYIKYRPTFTSDGYNTTFIDRAFERLLPRYYPLEIGYRDSVVILLSCADSTYQRTVLRRFASADQKGKAGVKQAATEKKDKPAENKADTKKQRKIFGYNVNLKQISKQLSFPVKEDSTVALLKMADFSYGRPKEAYKMIFDRLDRCSVQHLILDLRGNLGGRLSDVCELYSYLVEDDQFQFVYPAVITSKFNLPFYQMKGLPGWSYPILSPFIIPSAVVTWAKTFSRDGIDYTHLTGSKVKQSKANRYRGNLFVLIDGGTFSAASLIATNLKVAKRAVFVGEETGGAANGTVAGILPVLKLPNSHLRWRFGLMEVRPYYQVSEEGRGVMPDVPVLPSADDVVSGRDPAMDWVLNCITDVKF